ncbi:MAG: hypothetical protein IKY12_02680 [Clostridia bacterium]|nr:hypothetical protein [Clostridia bacterium]
MQVKFGAYLVIPLKYEAEKEYAEKLSATYPRYELTTMDISENVKNMFNSEGDQSIGSVFKISGSDIKNRFCDKSARLFVSKDEKRYEFDVIDSYVYAFNTRIAFLCLGISFSDMKALATICNPGFAQNSAEYEYIQGDSKFAFSLESVLLDFCGEYGFEGFFGPQTSLLIEAYTYVVALTDTMFDSLETIRKITFNLHQMQGIDVPVEDDSEGDIRYVYAVKNAALNAYRWGCCVTSQTIAYAVADPSKSTELCEEMKTQAADGLPIVLLALYEKYTCLRFTELIAQPRTRKLKTILKLKKLMLRFQAFGTVTPANLSRWNNVRQIYAYLTEVSDVSSAVTDISSKLDILVEEQQELENQRSSRIINLVTIFGIVGIMSSVQEIVQILSAGSNLMWSVTLFTTAVMALCFGLAMKK